jgi:hypothetical protein
VDDLVLAMNRAAESTPHRRPWLIDQYDLRHERSGCQSHTHRWRRAATAYFRKTTENHLSETLLPAIKSVTDKSDLARTYNNLAGTLARFGVETSDQKLSRSTSTAKRLMAFINVLPMKNAACAPTRRNMPVACWARCWVY